MMQVRTKIRPIKKVCVKFVGLYAQTLAKKLEMGYNIYNQE